MNAEWEANSAPKFVAEASSNHGTSMARAIELINAAASSGFDAIKFQLFTVTDLFASEILAHSSEHQARAAWELPFEFIPKLSRHAHKLGLEFSCTPFSLKAVNMLVGYVDFLKIASYELLWDDLLRKCAQTGLPLVVSTGMANMEEVRHAVDVAWEAGCRNLTLLHCVSSYPTPTIEANVGAIAMMREQIGVPVGWSDHTNDPAVIRRAVHRWGASFVELHLDLDGQGAEFAPGHCWLPDTAAAVIADIRTGIEADGHGRKEPGLSELPDREWRADPSDGLRPLLAERQRWLRGNKPPQP